MTYESKLNISNSVRKEVIRDIRDPDKWLKEERDDKSNLIVRARTHWEFHMNNDATQTISEIIFDKIISNRHRRKWRTHQVWGAIYDKGEFAQKHSHGKQFWSWVYYLDCCKECAPLVFDNTSIKPEVDLLVHFSGEEFHEVPRQTCDHERIILSGNIIKVKNVMNWSEAYDV